MVRRENVVPQEQLDPRDPQGSLGLLAHPDQRVK